MHGILVKRGSPGCQAETCSHGTYHSIRAGCWQRVLTHVLGSASSGQASHAATDDEDLGRRYSARCRDLAGKEPGEELSCLHHCPAHHPQYLFTTHDAMQRMLAVVM